MIAPGTKVCLEIVAVPRNLGGRKTLDRLCRKDPAVARHHRRQTKKRPSWEEWRRGGMMWHHQMKTRPVYRLARGEKFSLLATVDVLRDLASLGDCVKVGPA